MNVVFIGAPRFDDTKESDLEDLKMIGKWLKDT
jgi:hypothetical protein